MQTKLVTSIAPHKVDIQQQAIASWQKLGFDVVSLNSKKEIRQLESSFNGVEFYPVQRHAQKDCGKPMVYLDDIFTYIKKFGTPVSGIVNSDIHLSCSQGIKALVLEKAGAGLVFASRVDIDSVKHKMGTVYWGGFDVFLFDKTILEFIPPTEFCLGQPWWDFWVPLVCLNMLVRPIEVNYMTFPFAFHVKHAINWDNNDNYSRYGMHFMDLLASNNTLSMFQNKTPGELKGLLGSLCAQITPRILFANNCKWMTCEPF